MPADWDVCVAAPQQHGSQRWSGVLSVQQAVAAGMLQRAVEDETVGLPEQPSCTAKQFSHPCCSWRRGFHSLQLCARGSPETGLPMLAHEDEPHNLKLLVNHIHGQPAGADDSQLLISKTRILEAAGTSDALRHSPALLASTGGPEGPGTCDVGSHLCGMSKHA